MADLTLRPIVRSEIERIRLDCWPRGDDLDALFGAQQTIGLGAWEGNLCVGQLHGYRIQLPAAEVAVVPQAYRNELVAWPLTCALSAAAALLPGATTAWGHSCFHVGWIKGGQRKDPAYRSRGIGTALARASVAWAREQGYDAVIAHAAPAGLFEFADWFGLLPASSYAKLGFRLHPLDEAGDRLAAWAAGERTETVRAEAEASRLGERECVGCVAVLDLREER